MNKYKKISNKKLSDPPTPPFPLPTPGKTLRIKGMEELICLMCPESQFLDPKAEICWKTGGLYCKKLDIIVGKFDNCHEKQAPSAPGTVRKAAGKKASAKKAAPKGKKKTGAGRKG